jgi:hypothetical protein
MNTPNDTFIIDSIMNNQLKEKKCSICYSYEHTITCCPIKTQQNEVRKKKLIKNNKIKKILYKLKLIKDVLNIFEEKKKYYIKIANNYQYLTKNNHLKVLQKVAFYTYKYEKTIIEYDLLQNILKTEIEAQF